MENKPDQNLFREVHRKVQDLRDKARKNREDAVQRQKVAEDEAKKEGFERLAPIPQSEDGSE